MQYFGGTSQDPASVGAPGTWQRRLRLAAVVGAAASAVIALLSFVPVSPVPDALWGLLFVGAIAISVPTVISFQARARQSRISSRELQNLLFNRNRWIYLVVILAVVSFISGTTIQGQPEIHHGQYFLDDHGALTQVSHATYLRAMATQQRMFASFAAVFYSAASIFSSAPPQRSGDSGTAWPGARLASSLPSAHKGHLASLRAAVSAQICLPNVEKQQVSALY